MNSAKSTGSISDEAADRPKGSESIATFAVEHDDRPKSQSELSISSELNLNDSTIPSIDISNLASLAKLSNQSDSNLSEPSDSNFSLPSDSNDTANEREDDREDEEELVVTNALTNIQQNPFMQQDKKTKLLFRAAREIRDSEKTYVDTLSLICVHYKNAVRKSVNQTALDSLLQPFDTLLQLNTVLLTRFNHCIKNWDRQPKIANVLVELGPFLKHYADFATKFEQININYSEIKRKYPAFREATETFERDPSCKNLTIGHCMLKPIQRIGQYKLLIEKYLKYLRSDRTHPDYDSAIKALSTVTIAAEYTNEKMRENENFSKLLSIQQHITGGYEIIKPSRRLIKQNILHKISRKVKQERLFLLCSDCLIYLTIQKEGYKVNHELSLIGMRISSPEQEAFQNEILIRSSQRSIRVVTGSLAEKEEWMDEINRQIQNNLRRRSTLLGETESVSTGQYCIRSPMGPMCLGEEAPIWTPDSRVSMCQICTLDFTPFNRRHHCRACGKVVCSKCSKQQHYLIYSKRKQRVCDICFELLTKYAIPEQDEETPTVNGQSLSDQSKLSSSDPTLNGRLEPAGAGNHSRVSKNLRRNSSNQTTLSSRSSRNSSFFIEGQEQEQLNRERNEEILSSMLEETSSVENYDKNGVEKSEIDKNSAEKNGTEKNGTEKNGMVSNGAGQTNGSRPNSVNKQSSIERSHSTITKHPNEASYERSTKSRVERSTSLHDIEPPTPQPEQAFNRLYLRQSGRRRIPKVLTEISANEKESDMSGYMFKRKSKKSWRRLWFVLKQHVLYSFKQSEDVIAVASVPILGYSVQVSQVSIDNLPAKLILELTHQNLPTEHFRLESEQCVEKWLKALTAATSV